MNKKIIITFSTITFLFLVVFQNCGQKLQVSSENEAADNLNMLLTSKNCFENPAYDACIFNKNPVFEYGAPLGGLYLDELQTKVQNYGVGILTSSHYLKNENLSIQDQNGGRVEISDSNNWKFKSTDILGRLSHVNAFYWLSHTIQLLEKNTRINYFKNKNLNVIVNADTTGWSHAENKLYFGVSADGKKVAYDASLMIHLLGEAQSFLAAEGKNEISAGNPKHKSCGTDGEIVFLNSCCSSELGCARAINAGASDYLVGIIFPNAPVVGEYWVDDLKGLSKCGVSRDLRLASNLTAQSTYAACELEGAQGDIYIMGTFYASIWWNIRISLNEQQKKDFDRLYLMHLALVREGDDFKSIFKKIFDLDTTTTSNQFADLFKKEISKRSPDLL